MEEKDVQVAETKGTPTGPPISCHWGRKHICVPRTTKGVLGRVMVDSDKSGVGQVLEAVKPGSGSGGH